MYSYPASTFRRLCRETYAVSAVEFAIWAPVLCIVMLVGIDITRYAIATGRISDVASTIGEMLSVNTSGTVNYIDLQFYHDSAMVIYPQVLVDAHQQNVSWSNDMAITMTSVAFTATPPLCTSACSYVPRVVWSSGNNPRSCIVPMTSAGDTSTPSPKTLPQDVFGATSLLVVDIVYTFKPIFAGRLLNNLTISRSFYVTPRYVSTVGYKIVSGDPGTILICS